MGILLQNSKKRKYFASQMTQLATPSELRKTVKHSHESAIVGKRFQQN
jgi:hypothetical protein